MAEKRLWSWTREDGKQSRAAVSDAQQYRRINKHLGRGKNLSARAVLAASAIGLAPLRRGTLDRPGPSAVVLQMENESEIPADLTLILMVFEPRSRDQDAA